ncbi:hypothetical protein [Paenibacillus sp. FSL R7-0128]
MGREVRYGGAVGRRGYEVRYCGRWGLFRLEVRDCSDGAVGTVPA